LQIPTVASALLLLVFTSEGRPVGSPQDATTKVQLTAKRRWQNSDAIEVKLLTLDAMAMIILPLKPTSNR
jgi:hypothetical protein